MDRYLLSSYTPTTLSTYALTLYRHTTPHPFANANPSQKKKDIIVEFWDTAGQERFQSMHPSYYHGAHACVMVFDVGRKVTYKNLEGWYDEVVRFRGIELPVIVVANKIDMDPSRATKSFGFVERHRHERKQHHIQQQQQQSLIGGEPPTTTTDTDTSGDQGKDPYLPLFFASASDGTNVVSIFKEAIARAVKFKEAVEAGKVGSFVDEVMGFLEEERRAGAAAAQIREVGAQ
ncbi:Rab-like protein 2A [Borealophlyctis nickersoniae]|nr:Rab-like protein 2A [Borealophlyctis nickersoniae]